MRIISEGKTNSFFRLSSHEIDQDKIPSIKKRIISKLAK